MGISNGFGTLAGMLCPLFTEEMTKHSDQREWQRVFIMAGFIHFCGVAFYAIFASGELQPWAEPPAEATEPELPAYLQDGSVAAGGQVGMPYPGQQNGGLAAYGQQAANYGTTGMDGQQTTSFGTGYESWPDQNVQQQQPGAAPTNPFGAPQNQQQQW